MLGHSLVGPNNMAKNATYTVRLGFTNVTATALVGMGRNHVTMLTGNPDFATPTPSLASISSACDKLDSASQAYDFNRGKLEKEARDEAFKYLKELIRELGGYVQSNCKGQKDLILSTGFNVRRSNVPVGLLPAAKNLEALVTPYPGRLEVRWDGVKGRSMYQLWITDGDPNDAGGWRILLQSTKNRHVINDLVSNTVYTFRVVTLGTAGASPASDIAHAKAA